MTRQHKRLPRSKAMIAVVAMVGSAVALAVPSWASSGQAAPQRVRVPLPVVAGPVQTAIHADGTHGIPYTSSAVDLASNGYTESEYFASGVARAYEPVGALSTDGRWKVRKSSTAAYKTRFLVRKPVDMKKFSGRVVVEWLNVTVGRDLDVGWVFGNRAMMHDNDIYVGVSAQANGITNPVQGIKAWDPERYGSLVHPGDPYSYDIFSQIGAVLRHPNGANPISGGRVKKLVAYGDSQSAFRLVTYLNAVQNRDRVYDGVLVNSRFDAPAALNLDDGSKPASGTVIRSDSTAKVLELQTETDILRTPTGSAAARQPDTNRFRLWEVAGASHFNAPQEASMRIQAFRESPFADPPLQYNTCATPLNSLRFSDIVDTSIHDLGDWVTHGDNPPRAPRLQLAPSGSGYVKDDVGNTLGGIRLPQITVPTAVYSGVGTTGGASICGGLGGSTIPLPEATVRSLYPTHRAYVRTYAAAVQSAVKDGWVQPYDGKLAVAEAQASSTPSETYVP